MLNVGYEPFMLSDVMLSDAMLSVLGSYGCVSYSVFQACPLLVRLGGQQLHRVGLCKVEDSCGFLANIRLLRTG